MLCLGACFAMSGRVFASGGDVSDVLDTAASVVYPPPPPEYDLPDLLWNYQIGAGVNSTPLVADGVLYVGSDDSFLYALDAFSGDLLWRLPVETMTTRSAAAAGVVYVSSRDGNLYALDAAGGELLWQYKTGWSGQSPATVTVAGGAVYVGTNDGYLHALKAPQ